MKSKTYYNGWPIPCALFAFKYAVDEMMQLHYFEAVCAALAVIVAIHALIYDDRRLVRVTKTKKE